MIRDQITDNMGGESEYGEVVEKKDSRNVDDVGRVNLSQN